MRGSCNPAVAAAGEGAGKGKGQLKEGKTVLSLVGAGGEAAGADMETGVTHQLKQDRGGRSRH